MTDSDRMRIFLHNCLVHLHVGIYDAEMKAAQPVLINVELEAAQAHYYRDRTEKSLDRIISYEETYKFITEQLTKMGHFYLLETVAEQIADFCLKDPRVLKVNVRLEKTNVFATAVGAGIELLRIKPEASQ